MIAALALAALAAAGGSLTVASVFLKVDIPTLNRMSDSVVHARVVDVQSAWNADGSSIFTHVTLKVLGRLRGTTGDQIVVRIPGGTVGDFTIQMEGAPRPALHDEIVAFIGKWDDGVAMIAGYEQGMSHVEHDNLGNAILRDGLADGMPMSDLVRQVNRPGR